MRGLQVNKRSKVAHYILDSGQLLGVSKINVENLVPIKFDILKVPPNNPHAHIARASATFELTALEYVKNQDYKSACEALMVGIRYDRMARTKANKTPDFRLYDLLAGLSIRHGLPKYLQEVSAVLSHKKTSQSSTIYDTAFSSRMQKWHNLNGKWHKKRLAFLKGLQRTAFYDRGRSRRLAQNRRPRARSSSPPKRTAFEW